MSMTNQQGAPEAPKGTAADGKTELFNVPGYPLMVRAVDFNRLHAENERLAALVEAQQPAPSIPDTEAFQNFHRLLCARFGYVHDERDWRRDQLSLVEHIARQAKPSPTPQADSAPSAAAPVGEAPLPLLVRDIAADLGTTPIQVCTALAQLGFGGHSVNMAVTPRMAQSLRAHFASPTPQADSAHVAAPADTVVLDAALRAIHQAIDLIGEPNTERLRTVRRVLRGAVVVAEDGTAPQADSQPAPIDMVLHCPACGLQHIDASEPPVEFEPGAAQWNNPPHRSHLCHGCGHIWRPADVPTNGVKAVKTKGKADSPIAARAPADSVTAAAGGVVAGPSKWTDEEIADGKRGIRWVTEGVIHGRPTDHDVREYLMRTPAMRGCLCDDCRTFYAPTPPAQAADSVLEDADPLQGAANWLAEAHGQFCVAVLQGCLMIGYNRAKRLHDAAIAARKQGGA